MRKRVIISVIVLIAIMLISSFANQEPTEWKEYVVKSGDTICGIAKSITPDGEDYRRAEHYIMEKNDLYDGMIYPTQVILIPEM